MLATGSHFFFKDVSFANNQHVRFIDLSPGTGDLLRAFLTVKDQLNVESSFIALVESSTQNDWLEFETKEFIRHEWLEGRLKVRGKILPSLECPLPDLDNEPTKPELTTLCWQSDAAEVPQKIPQPVLDIWENHKMFGEEFSEKLKELLHLGIVAVCAEKHGVQTQDWPTPTKKRIGFAPMSARKKTKVTNIDDPPTINYLPMPLPTETSFNVKITVGVAHSKQHFSLTCAATGADQDCNILLINDSEETRFAPEGTFVVGLSKGVFANAESGDDPQPSELMFKFESSDDLVLVNGSLSTLQKAVADRKQIDPSDGKIAFHETQGCGLTSKGFNLKLNKQVVWKPKDAGVPNYARENFGLVCVPFSRWNSQLTRIVWACKWNTMKKGLLPVKPVVVTTRDLKFEPETYVELVGDSEK